MPTPYPVKFKLPLEFLTLQDWNNFVQNLLFLNQYGSAQLLKYYQNGNFKNINDVIAEYLYVSTLKVKGYNVLHNLSEPLAYTFGEGRQQPFESMVNRPTVSFPYSIPFEFIQFYPLSELPNYKLPIFPVEKLQVQLAQVSKQLQLLIPKLTSKITVPTQIAGTQFQFSGTTNVQTLIEDYLNPQYLQTWREIIIQNLGTSAVQINNSIYLMPKNCLKITANSPSEIQLTAQTPTLLSEEIEFVGTTGTPITTYTITITNNQANPTPSSFQQLLNLNLSSILSSSSQLLNLEFCLDVNCNTPLYAWIEQNNLSNVYIWIKIPTSIPANSSITIYMFVRNSIQYPYTGIAPYLTSTYGQYDNGNNVFNIYQNFVGTTLPSGWTAVSGTSGTDYVVNNGLQLKTTSAFIEGSNVTQNFILEGYFQFISNAYNGWDFGVYSSPSSAYGMHPDGGGNTNNWVSTWYYNNGYTEISGSGDSVGTGYYYIWQIINNAGSITVNFNNPSYTVLFSASFTNSLNNAPIALGKRFNGTNAGQSLNVIFYWIRVRAYPPNGVMPSNSQPQKTIILLS